MEKNNKSKVVIFVFLALMLGGFLLAFLSFQNIGDLQEEMIYEVIAERGGEVKQIQIVSLNESPFTASERGNTIYKVDYWLNGEERTAWYRADNQSSIVKEPEEWIFE